MPVNMDHKWWPVIPLLSPYDEFPIMQVPLPAFSELFNSPNFNVDILYIYIYIFFFSDNVILISCLSSLHACEIANASTCSLNCSLFTATVLSPFLHYFLIQQYLLFA